MAKTIREKAYNYYRKNRDKITFKAIAQKFGVSESTLRRWRKEDDWDDDVSNKKKMTRGSPKKRSQKTVEYELTQSDGLNDRQLLFCMHYVRYWNATKAYQKAYECDYRTAHANAHRMMANDGIKIEIERLKKNLADGLMLSAEAVLQKYIDIAFADITDYSDFGTVEEIVKDETGKPILDYQGEEMTYQRTYVNLKNASEVDGTLITEVKKGKDGVSVKLVDKMAAMAVLAKCTNMLDDRTARLQQEKLKVDIAKVRSETKGAGGRNTAGVDLSNLTPEELRALAARNKR